MILACAQILSLLFSCVGETDSGYKASVDGSEGRRVLEAKWIRSSRAVEPAEIDESDIDIPRPETPGFWEPWREEFAAPAGSVRRWLFATEVQVPPGAGRLALETGWKTRLFQGDSLRVYVNGFPAGSFRVKTDSVVTLDAEWMLPGSKNDLLLVMVSKRSGSRIELPRLVSLPDTSLRGMKYGSFAGFGFGYTDSGGPLRLLRVPERLLLRCTGPGSADFVPTRPTDTDLRTCGKVQPGFRQGRFEWNHLSDLHWYDGWHRHRRIFRSNPQSVLGVAISNLKGLRGRVSRPWILGVIPVEHPSGFLRPGSDTVDIDVYYYDGRVQYREVADSSDPASVKRSGTPEMVDGKTLLHWNTNSRDSRGRFLGVLHGNDVSWTLSEDTLTGFHTAFFEPPPSMKYLVPRRWWKEAGCMRTWSVTISPLFDRPSIDSVGARNCRDDDSLKRWTWYRIGDLGMIGFGSLGLEENRIRAKRLAYEPDVNPIFDGLDDTTKPWIVRLDTFEFAWNPRSTRDSLVACNLRIELRQDLPLFGNLRMGKGSVVAFEPRRGSWLLRFEGSVGFSRDSASFVPVSFSLDSSNRAGKTEFQAWRGRLQWGDVAIFPEPGDSARIGARFRARVPRYGKRASPRRLELLFRNATARMDGRPDCSGRIRRLSIDEDGEWSISISTRSGNQTRSGRFARPQDSD